MMDVSGTYCGNHFTIYVNQTIMLYPLNLYSDVYQLFLNKIGNKKKKQKKYFTTCTGLMKAIWLLHYFQNFPWILVSSVIYIHSTPND